MSCSVPFTPVVVGKQNFSLTSNLSATTLYTPSEDGDFEVTLYASQDPTLNGSADVKLSWVDDFNTYSTKTLLSTNSGQPSYWQETLHVTSGNPIQISAAYSLQGGSALPVNVYATVTKK